MALVGLLATAIMAVSMLGSRGSATLSGCPCACPSLADESPLKVQLGLSPAPVQASREPSQLRGSGDQADSGPQAPEPADVCLVSVPHPSPGDAGLLQDPQRPDGAASCSAPPSPNQPPESSPVLPRVVTTLPPSGPSPRVSSLDVLPPQRGGWGAASRHSSAGEASKSTLAFTMPRIRHMHGGSRRAHLCCKAGLQAANDM